MLVPGCVIPAGEVGKVGIAPLGKGEAVGFMPPGNDEVPGVTGTTPPEGEETEAPSEVGATIIGFPLVVEGDCA